MLAYLTVNFLFQTRLMNQRKLKNTVVLSNGGGAVPAIYTSASDCLMQVSNSVSLMPILLATCFANKKANVLLIG